MDAKKERDGLKMNMRKITLILVVLLLSVFCLSACSGDDSISGTYKMTKLSTADISMDGDLLEQVGYGDSYIEFTDGSFTMVIADDQRSGTYTEAEGGTLTFTMAGDATGIVMVENNNTSITLDLQDGFTAVFEK